MFWKRRRYYSIYVLHHRTVKEMDDYIIAVAGWGEHELMAIAKEKDERGFDEFKTYWRKPL